MSLPSVKLGHYYRSYPINLTAALPVATNVVRRSAELMPNLISSRPPRQSLHPLALGLPIVPSVDPVTVQCLSDKPLCGLSPHQKARLPFSPYLFQAFWFPGAGSHLPRFRLSQQSGAVESPHLPSAELSHLFRDPVSEDFRDTRGGQGRLQNSRERMESCLELEQGARAPPSTFNRLSKLRLLSMDVDTLLLRGVLPTTWPVDT
ncbi:hypothetical protein CLAIMM_03203 [Cladophialophora immunda]|nr:hypothetical protein CLAIMM_03203 [Cladophialophora immunda]